jgi:DNA-binding NtrC family response regulator
MRMPPHLKVATIPTIPVLSVSPFPEDHRWLEQILCPSECKFVLKTSDTLAAAATVLCRHQFSVVICEYDLLPGSWTDVLAITSDLTIFPSIIVTSRFAEERKWAEVLNLGAFDLLIKPFDDEEVRRVVNAAWHHWRNRRHSNALTPQICRTALG